MKKHFSLIVTLSVVLSTIQFCQAQTAAKRLKSYLDIMDTAKTEQTWKTLSYGFEKISIKDSTNWLANYYTAYAYSIYGIRIADNTAKAALLERALTYINKADELKPNESEVYVLKGAIMGMQISVDPMLGESIGPESMELTKKGRDLNPENPRAWLELGQMTMYTPEQYGGSKKNAEKQLKTAEEKFKNYKNADPLWPHWGQDRLQTVLEEVKTK
jgi:hypothetical protein